MKISTAKVVALGDNETGKTAMLRWFLSGTPACFVDHYTPTLGADFCILEVKVDDGEFHLYFWDLNGCTPFKLLRRYYIHGMNAYFIMFDVTRPETFEHVRDWHDEARKVNPKATGLLIGTHIDKVQERKVSEEAIANVARELGYKAITVSAKTGEHCLDALREIVKILAPQDNGEHVALGRKDLYKVGLGSNIPSNLGNGSFNKIASAKVAILGDNETGKSALLRWIDGKDFMPDYKPTFCLDSIIKDVGVGITCASLFIWDYNGLHSIRNIRAT